MWKHQIVGLGGRICTETNLLTSNLTWLDGKTCIKHYAPQRYWSMNYKKYSLQRLYILNHACIKEKKPSNHILAQHSLPTTQIWQTKKSFSNNQTSRREKAVAILPGSTKDHVVRMWHSSRLMPKWTVIAAKGSSLSCSADQGTFICAFVSNSTSSFKNKILAKFCYIRRLLWYPKYRANQPMLNR